MIDGHRVILGEIDQSHLRQDQASITAHDIDLRRLVEDRLTGASPNLLRELLSMFMDILSPTGRLLYQRAAELMHQSGVTSRSPTPSASTTMPTPRSPVLASWERTAV